MKFIRKLVYGSVRGFEYNELIRQARRFPRYTNHRFHFQGMDLSVTDFLSVAWQLKEIFLDEQLKFPTGKSSPLIIDCGSNVGISILYFKKIFPASRILAFEPDPLLLGVLRKNLEANHIEGVELTEKVVWTGNEGVNFGSDGADGGSVYSAEKSRRLPSIRLKDVLLRGQEIDFLKMDIEGAETDVLIDCADALGKVQHLFVEYHAWPQRPRELDRILHLLSSHKFHYYIRSTGEAGGSPLLRDTGTNEMDMQLNIYATKRK